MIGLCTNFYKIESNIVSFDAYHLKKIDNIG